MADDGDLTIGDYKIEISPIFGGGTVRKALGPWPLRNWSWVSFYHGSVEDCREYVRWAERVDAEDSQLLEQAQAWIGEKLRLPPRPVSQRSKLARSVLHLPKCWGYDFKQALALPAPVREQTSDSSGALFATFIALIILFILVVFGHSFAGPPHV